MAIWLHGLRATRLHWKRRGYRPGERPDLPAHHYSLAVEKKGIGLKENVYKLYIYRIDYRLQRDMNSNPNGKDVNDVANHSSSHALCECHPAAWSQSNSGGGGRVFDGRRQREWRHACCLIHIYVGLRFFLPSST